MKRQHLAAAAILLTACATAHASELSYSHIEAGFAQGTLDVPAVEQASAHDLHPLGVYAQGSIELGGSLYLLGGALRGSDDLKFAVNGLDPMTTDVDVTQYHFGLGYHYDLTNAVDLLMEFSYLRSEVDALGVDLHSDGFRVAIGARSALGARLEGWAKLHYSDGDFFNSSTGAHVGAQLRLDATWGLVAAADLNEDYNAYTLGMRARF